MTACIFYPFNLKVKLFDVGTVVHASNLKTCEAELGPGV